MNSEEYALVVAGGKGSRMGTSLPKQFLSLAGKPLILHTLDAFYQYSENIKVVLVLPGEDFATWKKICEQHGFDRDLTLVEGGASRFQSVKRGLEKVGGNGLVAIHDGVRPLVNQKMIALSFQTAAIHQTAIAAVPLKDSIRMVNGEENQALNRASYALIQTPQTFSIPLIKSAYTQQEDPKLTDDASVAEKAGYKIKLYEGHYNNIKITTPEDLVVAEAILKQGK